MKKKNTVLRVAVQMVTFVITLTILIQGAQYMTSVLKFMGLRDSMEYMEECAYNYKWTVSSGGDQKKYGSNSPYVLHS